MISKSGGRVGSKSAVTGSSAVVATQHPIVTDVIINILQDGGNAIDAAIAGALVQGVVQPEMTNYTGSVNVLYYENSTNEFHELNSTGTIVPDLAPFRPVPGGRGMLTAHPMARSPLPPMAVIPGYMPAMKAMLERFGTMSWQSLCEPAIRWATEGNELTSLQSNELAACLPLFSYTESGRAHFYGAEGHPYQVGDIWRKPALAALLRRLSVRGPDDMIEGEWADAFVARAQALGWDIGLHHMKAIAPRWGKGLRYSHGEFEIVQLAPPERQAVFTSIALGMFDALNLPSIGHYSENADAAYLASQALRRATHEVGYLHDPEVFGDPSGTLMDRSFHQALADVLSNSRPNVDMSRHVEICTSGRLRSAQSVLQQPPGSCESAIIDSSGNWVQMMNTWQGGGIPGEVIEGVPMVGSHATTWQGSDLCGWYSGGGRNRTIIASTFILKNGSPWLSLGSPANGCRTAPLVISNLLDYGMSPEEAEDLPRLMPMTDDYEVSMEARVPPEFAPRLAQLGAIFDPREPYDSAMGSFQMAWRDQDGTLHSIAGSRREGMAAGF
jgi:gamma-glutamyltranspeptidase / glutathione hydrolase